MTTAVHDDLEQTLSERFGLERFRPGQRRVIEAVLSGRDVLCVMPTGGGKSLCYQLPAVQRPGVTLVVSPLIALMKDQVDALQARGVKATLINSTLDAAETSARLAEIEMGRHDLVYVAPERFRSGRFLEVMQRVRPALLAVDEAHCISEWGHDFRPDYARLGHARRTLGMPPCIALTATATDLVRRDIADQLDLRDPAQFITGFDRPNLSYHVIETRKDTDKLSALADTLNANPGSAIVYASSRKRCEEVASYLERQLRRSVTVYHAGLERDQRTEAQDRFMGGGADIVVATNAFGMGVDKPDIRSVIHYNIPGTLEAYYQEAGRAGRDGLPAQCVLLFAPGDRFLQEMFIENEYPPRQAVFRIYDFLRGIDADPIELTQAEIKESAGLELNESAVGAALKILEGAGALERFRPRENMAIIRFREEAQGTSLVDRLGPQAQSQRIVLLALEGLVKGRYGETVYFHPDEFATAIGLDRPALTRAIKALSSHLPIDYVPPFRGNAVRILDRDRRARDLTIDFSALEARRDQEYDKLERMLRYAQTRDCRRAYILGYFGDVDAGNCGRCDRCGDSRPELVDSALIDTEAGREVVRKALSGVARAKGRFGKTVVAQMLTGSSSEKMDRFGLSKLSTFGILSDFKQAEVSELIDALVATGLVDASEVDRFRPIVNLTERGWSLLRQPGDFDLSLPLSSELGSRVRLGGLSRLLSKPTPAEPRLSTPLPVPAGIGDAGERARQPSPAPNFSKAEESDADVSVDRHDPLRERLARMRSEWAKEAKLSPGYVLSNETIDLLVRERPTTPHALANIKGIGPSKLERYGSALLAAIAGEPRTAEPPSVAEPPRPPAPPRPAAAVPPREAAEAPKPRPPSEDVYVPTEEWTRRLLERGFTIDEAAAIRGLDRSAIVRHATLSARQGRKLALSTILEPDCLERWDAWRREHGDEAPTDAGDLWPLYLACRSAAS